MHPESLSRSISIYLERLRLKTAFKSRADRRDSRVIDERERKKERNSGNNKIFSINVRPQISRFRSPKIIVGGERSKKTKKKVKLSRNRWNNSFLPAGQRKKL